MAITLTTQIWGTFARENCVQLLEATEVPNLQVQVEPDDSGETREEEASGDVVEGDEVEGEGVD